MINSAEYLALRAFVVVAQQLNFRAAAEILGYLRQPSVSKSPRWKHNSGNVC